MPADSIAMSVPEDMAIPISDWASAGASLMPSPTIATISPFVWSFFMIVSLSCGRSSAWTWLIPACSAIYVAVFLSSPVSMRSLRC